MSQWPQPLLVYLSPTTALHLCAAHTSSNLYGGAIHSSKKGEQMAKCLFIFSSVQWKVSFKYTTFLEIIWKSVPWISNLLLRNLWTLIPFCVILWKISDNGKGKGAKSKGAKVLISLKGKPVLPILDKFWSRFKGRLDIHVLLERIVWDPPNTH